MSAPQPGRSPRSGVARRPSQVGLATVCIFFTAFAAATFVQSYSGMHAFVLQSGVKGHEADGYPVLLDAMLVIAGVAVIWLRDAGLPSKLLAWFTLLVVLAAAAGADALHAAGDKLPDAYAPVIAAVVPWGLAFIGFSVLLVMLRHARARAHAGHGPNADAHLSVRNPGGSGHFAQPRASAPPGQVKPGQVGSGSPPRLPDPNSSFVPGFDRASVITPPEPPPLVVAVPRQLTQDSVADADSADPEVARKAGADAQFSIAAAASAGARAAQAEPDTDVAQGTDPSKTENQPDSDPSKTEDQPERDAGIEPLAETDSTRDPDAPPEDPSADEPAADPVADPAAYPTESVSVGGVTEADELVPGDDDPEMQVFHRSWSPPVQPNKD